MLRCTPPPRLALVRFCGGVSPELTIKLKPNSYTPNCTGQLVTKSIFGQLVHPVRESFDMGFLVFLNISFFIVVCVFVIVRFHSPDHSLFVSNHLRDFGYESHQQDCEGLHSLEGYVAKCLYVKSDHHCVSQGFINYLYLFYCKFGNIPFLGYSLLFLWLLVLFYVLANTASEYFCPSLEQLSKLLKLSPTIAGVTLLSLGNGACDVFASFASFKSSGTRGIGFNTIIGGGSFVSCVVVGVISICTRRAKIRICKYAFIRDVCFYFLVLVCLILILVAGEINVWGAVGYSLLYVVYAAAVIFFSASRLKGFLGENESYRNSVPDCSGLSIPILSTVKKEEVDSDEETAQGCEIGVIDKNKYSCVRSSSFNVTICILGLPLDLPRRLTIPVICEERWSKPYAVLSVTLAPVLSSVMLNPYKGSEHYVASMIVNGIGLIIGFALGFLAFLKVEKSSPPKRCQFPWLAGGFLMSVTWSYITAKELVGLLVSLGYICGISPSILGLTVLAWGNSLGDLTTNLTMALKGGREGIQVAISGCYAGPIFNTLLGLGLSLVNSSWSDYPSSVVIPSDPYLWESLGFLIAGLLWALVVLTVRDMTLDGMLGVGLLVIYFSSLFLRLIQTLGFFKYTAI